MTTRRAMQRKFIHARCTCVFALACIPLVAQQTPPSTASGGYRIEGTVLSSATGEPVRRAVMSLLEMESNRPIVSVVTDAQGHFSFIGLAASKYPLMASKRGYRDIFYDDHNGYNTAIVTGPDQDTTHLIFFLIPGAVLRGVVSADGGDPVEGARVMLFQKPRGHEPDAHVMQVDATITDDAGMYEFANVAEGDYFIAVQAQPWYAMHHASQNAPNDLDVAYPVTYYDSATEEGSATPLSIGKGAREQADVHLHAVPALRFVVDAVRKRDGRLARPEVQQIVFGLPIFAESVGFVDALNKGSAEFTGMAPGHYEFTLGDPPHIVDLDASSNSVVQADAGSPFVPVTGTVHTPDGGLLSDEANLVLRPAEGAMSHANQSTPIRNGRFRLEAVAPGNWLIAIDRGGTVLPVLGVGAGSSAHAGDMIAVRDRALDLAVVVGQGLCRVEGVAQKNDKGAGGAMIVLVPNDQQQMGALARRDQSDSDGSFALRDVVPGQYTLVAIEDGWKLDWAAPGALARYLPAGTAVTVGYSSEPVRLAGPIPIQPR